jgi:hypothetical protein
MGSGCIDPYFLDLGTSLRLVVRFTHRPLYPRGKSTQNSFLWRYSSILSKMSALRGGEYSASCPSFFTMGKDLVVPFDGRVPSTTWKRWRMSVPVRNRPPGRPVLSIVTVYLRKLIFPSDFIILNVHKYRPIFK